MLAGVDDSPAIVRCVVRGGHKALYADDWDGLPEKEFLTRLDPIAGLRDRLYEKAHDAQPSGLGSEWAKKLGLPADIPIAIGEIDATTARLVAEWPMDVIVKIIGTSTCDCGMRPAEQPLLTSRESAASSPVRSCPASTGSRQDNRPWAIFLNGGSRTSAAETARCHGQLRQRRRELKPGESGLVALDWNNGNRTILVDPLLTGLAGGANVAHDARRRFTGH